MRRRRSAVWRGNALASIAPIVQPSQSQAASRGHRTLVEAHVCDECQRQGERPKPWRSLYRSLRRIAFGVPPMNAGCCRLRPLRATHCPGSPPTTLNPLPCSGRIQLRHPVNTASVASTAPDTSRPTSGVYQARSPICHSCRTGFGHLYGQVARAADIMAPATVSKLDCSFQLDTLVFRNDLDLPSKAAHRYRVSTSRLQPQGYL